MVQVPELADGEEAEADARRPGRVRRHGPLRRDDQQAEERVEGADRRGRRECDLAGVLVDGRDLDAALEKVDREEAADERLAAVSRAKGLSF